MLSGAASLLPEETSLRLGWTLLHSLWQLTLLGGVYQVFYLCARRRSAALRYWVGCGIFVLMVAAPFATFFARTNAPAFSVVRTEQGDNAAANFSAANPIPTSAERAEKVPLFRIQASPALRHWIAKVERWLPSAVLLWFFGVALMLVRGVRDWYLVRRLLHKGVFVPSQALRETVATLIEKMGIDRSVRVLQSALTKTPLVVGWVKPVILAPLGLAAAMTPAQLEVVLAHELAHIRRWDYLVNLLQTLGETLFFYHPALWWLSERIRFERENCCDDTALTTCGNAVEYAKALASVAEFGAKHGFALAAHGLPGKLLGRIQRVLGDVESGTAPASGLAVALVGAGLLLLASLLQMDANAALRVRPRLNQGEPTSRLAYECDFESGFGSEWSIAKTEMTPVGGRRFLGRFGKRTQLDFHLGELPPHRLVRVRFDLHVIGLWQEWANGFRVTAGGGRILLRTTIANAIEGLAPARQSWPDFWLQHGLRHPATTGAKEKNTLGYTLSDESRSRVVPADSVYAIDLIFPHNASVLLLTFADRCDHDMQYQAWGIDNFRVETIDELIALDPVALQQSWNDLVHPDPMVALRARWRLQAAGPDAVAFIASQIDQRPGQTAAEALPRETRLRHILEVIGTPEAQTQLDRLGGLLLPR